MAIRDERTSTAEILRDSRFHRAALAADPRTAQLAAGLGAAEAKLRKAAGDHDERDNLRTDALAVLLRTDFELDEKLRLCELAVLAAVNKNREELGYKAVFPRGLSAVLVLRGEEAAKKVVTLAGNLKKHFPKLAPDYGVDLAKMAQGSSGAERAWRQAEADAAAAFGDELIARVELVRQLQKNEGALLAVFPGQRRRVRSFFRPTRRRGAAPDTGEPEAPSGP